MVDSQGHETLRRFDEDGTFHYKVRAEFGGARTLVTIVIGLYHTVISGAHSFNVLLFAENAIKPDSLG